jgi:6-phosphogluconolactonase
MRWLVSCVLLALSCTAALADHFVYVSVAGDQRIAVYRLHPNDGTLKHHADVAVAGEPGALTTDPKQRFLFVAIRSTGQLAAFNIDGRTGLLKHINTVPAGADPAHLSTDNQGRLLFCAYYVAAKITSHAIAPDGALSPKPRQTIATADKAHAILLDPANRIALVPHTGPNAIFQFAFDRDTRDLKPAATPKLTTPANTGPRHLVYHPSQPIAYVVNEQGGSVTAYRLDAQRGTLQPFQTVSTLPPGFHGKNACAEIKLRPDGKFLYASNRGHDSIACFAVNPKDGSLTARGQTPTEKTPRSFDLGPDGRFLYAAGESSGKLAAYRIHPTTGALERFATYEAGRRPWWVLVVRLP